MAAPPYTYKPLHSPTHVRRIRSVDNGPAAGLHFRISQFDQDISSTPTYYCLSYTWGNPLDCEADPEILDEWKDQHEVFLCEDGDDWKVISVTTNLYEFLCEFSATGPSSEISWIWIDAICINQNDLAERTAQVSLMRKIYLDCSEVIIWLGREGEETQSVSDLISLAEKADQTTLSMLQKLYKSGQPFNKNMCIITDLISGGFPEADRAVYNSLTAFLRRSWFHRIWTMQESVLPKKGQVWCGAVRFTDMKVFPKIGFIAGIYLSLTEELDQGYTWPVVSALDYLHNFLFADSSPDGSRQFLSGGATLDTLACLHYSRGKKCTVPHDHIYATLGLQREQLAQADYKISVKELYTRVALHPSTRCFSFENAGLGAGSGLGRDWYCTSNLPSWVPDWSSPLNPRAWSHRHPRDIYSTGGSNERNFNMTRLSEDVVRVAGFQEDEVLLLGGHGSPFSPNSTLRCLQVLNTACEEPYNIVSTEDLTERLWRTLIVDLENTGAKRPSTEKYGPAFRDYVLDKLSLYVSVCDEDDEWEEVRSALDSIMKRDETARHFLPTWHQVESAAREKREIVTDGDFCEQPSLKDTYAQALVRNFHSRRFFITAKGRMGVSVDITEVGDAIMVVKEHGYPLIMRKGKEGRWQLVSQAYVEDIMHGEALVGKAFDNIDIE